MRWYRELLVVKVQLVGHAFMACVLSFLPASDFISLVFSLDWNWVHVGRKTRRGASREDARLRKAQEAAV